MLRGLKRGAPLEVRLIQEKMRGFREKRAAAAARTEGLAKLMLHDTDSQVRFKACVELNPCSARTYAHLVKAHGG